MIKKIEKIGLGIEKRLDVIFKNNRIELRKTHIYRGPAGKQIKIKKRGRLVIRFNTKKPCSGTVLSSVVQLRRKGS